MLGDFLVPHCVGWMGGCPCLLLCASYYWHPACRSCSGPKQKSYGGLCVALSYLSFTPFTEDYSYTPSPKCGCSAKPCGALMQHQQLVQPFPNGGSSQRCQLSKHKCEHPLPWVHACFLLHAGGHDIGPFLWLARTMYVY